MSTRNPTNKHTKLGEMKKKNNFLTVWELVIRFLTISVIEYFKKVEGEKEKVSLIKRSYRQRMILIEFNVKKKFSCQKERRFYFSRSHENSMRTHVAFKTIIVTWNLSLETLCETSMGFSWRNSSICYKFLTKIPTRHSHRNIK